MGRLYLVRHADAGDRHDFDGPDQRRPLSERGRRQAAGLRDQLVSAGITRLLASPYLRCVQTLEPLGATLGIDVEPDDRLAEGQGAMPPLALAEELRATPVAFCSHGDVIPDVLDEAMRRHVEVLDELRWKKASVWVLTWDDDRLATASYLPPPS
jgi:broad specificity phosphatase PhoE